MKEKTDSFAVSFIKDNKKGSKRSFTDYYLQDKYCRQYLQQFYDNEEEVLALLVEKDLRNIIGKRIEDKKIYCGNRKTCTKGNMVYVRFNKRTKLKIEVEYFFGTLTMTYELKGDISTARTDIINIDSRVNEANEFFVRVVNRAKSKMLTLVNVLVIAAYATVATLVGFIIAYPQYLI